MRTETLKVEGMHCRSCEMILEETLDDLGVNDSKISHEKGEVKVTFDESLTTLEQIRKAIEKEGYEVIA